MKQRYKEILYLIESGGLCNRIRALISYQALAELWRVPLCVYWPTTWSCPEDISNLYQISSFNLIDKEKAKQLFREQRKDRLAIRMCKGDITRIARPEQVHKHFASDFMSLEEFTKLFLKCLRRLEPLPYIKEKIESFAEKFKIQETIGIHVRLTDNIFDLRFRRLYGKSPPTIHTYQKVMDNYIREDDTVRFFLACDDINLERQMRNKYGKRLVVFEKEYKAQEIPKERYRQTSLQDALVDIYLLAKTRKIIDLPDSTFGWMAAELGAIPCEPVCRTRKLVRLVMFLFPIEQKVRRLWARLLKHF